MEIRIQNLSYGYLKQPLCIKNLSVDIFKGKPLAILGNEGAGKTSLLRVIAGLEKQYVGNIFFDEKNVNLIPLHDREVSYIPSEPVFLENKTVSQNFEFLFRVSNRQFDERIVVEVLEKFGLRDVLCVKVKKLSLVQKKILSLARSYLKNPKIVLLDDLFMMQNKTECEQIKNAILTYIHGKVNEICLIYVENAKNQLQIADHFLYASYGLFSEFKEIKQLMKNPIDLFSYEYFESYKKDYNISFDGNNFFLIDGEYIEKTLRKRKYKEFVIGEKIVFPETYKGALNDQKLEPGEQMQVCLAGLEDFKCMSIKEVMKCIILSKIVIFDKNTFVKIV